jgi:hypothetical protein
LLRVNEGKGNAALKLTDMLTQDKLLRRFSIISFDLDVKANEKAIRQLVNNNYVVGSIAANRPDFEFANFTVQELADIAARMDESHGFSGAPIRKAESVPSARRRFCVAYLERARPHSSPLSAPGFRSDS